MVGSEASSLVTRELVPWGARKRWHRRWHRPVFRLWAGLPNATLVVGCGIPILESEALVRQAPGRTRAPVCSRCSTRLMLPRPVRRAVAPGQIEAFR